MAGLPTVQVLLDDVNNGGTWPYDITTKVRLTEGYTISTRGRSDEDSEPSPVTLNLTLDNTDGRFTLGSTSGGYGAINVDRGIRVKVTANGVTTTRFTGFVKAWPVDWPNGSDKFALVRVTAVDAMERWSRRTLRSIIEEQIIADNPAFYYTLGDPEGSATASDSSDNQQVPALKLGGGVLPVFGSATGPGTDGLTAADFGGGYLTVGAHVGTSAPPGVWWISVAFLTTGPTETILNYNSVPTGSLFALSTDAAGKLVAGTRFHNLTSAVSVTDGATHHAAMIEDAGTGDFTFYLDGAVVGTVVAGDGATPGGDYLNVGNTFTGVLAHLAGGMTLSGTPAARFAAHAEAVRSGFAGERSDVRIERLAEYEGSAPLGASEDGLTFVPFVDFTGQSVAAAVAQVAESEGGAAYIDGIGRVATHNRQHTQLRTVPDLTVLVDSDLLDPGTSMQADAQQVINYAVGNRVGGSQLVAIDTVSHAIRGRYPGGGEYLVFTDQEVLDRLNWLVNTHAEPVARVPDLVFDLLTATAAVQAAVMALDVDSRVQVTGLPSQAPTGVVADLSLLGYSEALSKDGWRWSANTVSWPAYEQAWVLGDATYGQLGITTRLAV